MVLRGVSDWFWPVAKVATRHTVVCRESTRVVRGKTPLVLMETNKCLTNTPWALSSMVINNGCEPRGDYTARNIILEFVTNRT